MPSPDLSESCPRRKRWGWWVLFGGVLGFMVLIPSGLGLWLFGSKHHDFTKGRAGRLQYFDSPPLMAVHFRSEGAPPQVFVVNNIHGQNQQEMAERLDPKNIEIGWFDLSANSIYESWTDTTEARDVLRMGLLGKSRLKKYEFMNDGRVGLNVGDGDYPHGSFKLMDENEFASMSKGTLVHDLEVGGRITFSISSQTYWRSKPRRTYIGP